MFLLKNGIVFTPKGWLKGCSVLTEKSKIVNVGKSIKKPAKAKVVDCTGLYVIPGIVEAHSHLGVYEEGAGIMGYHYNEGSDPITPQVRAVDAVFPRDPGFRYALEGGITTVVANPGSANLIGGLNVVLKCYPNAQTVEEMIIKEPEGMKFALGENPFRFYGKDQGKPPKTRMGSAATTRAAMMKCRDYIAKKKKLFSPKNFKIFFLKFYKILQKKFQKKSKKSTNFPQKRSKKNFINFQKYIFSLVKKKFFSNVFWLISFLYV